MRLPVAVSLDWIMLRASRGISPSTTRVPGNLLMVYCRVLFLCLGFGGRILEGVGAGLLQTSGNISG
jgi:hypothetical protein